MVQRLSCRHCGWRRDFPDSATPAQISSALKVERTLSCLLRQLVVATIAARLQSLRADRQQNHPQLF
jgi:hypothetical protein